MNAFTDAFAKAGYQDAEEWPSAALCELAEQAMVKHANDTEAAIREIFNAVCKPNSLSRALFGPWAREACSALIAHMRRRMKAAQGRAGLSDRQRKLAEMIRKEEEQAEAAAQRAREQAQEERGRASLERERQLNEWLANKARDEKIDDRPWWEATPARLVQWQRRLGHRARFFALVLERMPNDDDIHPLSYYLRPDEIDEMWDAAWGNQFGY